MQMYTGKSAGVLNVAERVGPVGVFSGISVITKMYVIKQCFTTFDTNQVLVVIINLKFVVPWLNLTPVWVSKYYHSLYMQASGP